MTQKELAERVGMKQPSYNKIERAVLVQRAAGKEKSTRPSSPTLETIDRLATALNVDPVSLIIG